jgi:prevent-host-death family protein
MLKQGIDEIGHRQLREELAPLLRKLGETGRPAAVTNRNKIEAVIVPARTFDEMAQAQADLGQLRNVLPLLLAAAAAGTAIPSETLDHFGLTGAFDWRSINAFQAAFPVRITHDESGAPLPTLRSARPAIAVELEDELTLE